MPKRTSECALCEEEVNVDFFCYGCGAYICENCRVEHPSGKHKVEDHCYNEAQS